MTGPSTAPTCSGLNNDFFNFDGQLISGRIECSYGGIPTLDNSQTMTALNQPTPDVLAAPPNAQLRQYCKTYRRPFGKYMPQPKPSGGGSAGIVVRGTIWPDGRVHNPVVQHSERPDLNPQALSIIQQWTFTPAMCNGKPNSTNASFMLHFH